MTMNILPNNTLKLALFSLLASAMASNTQAATQQQIDQATTAGDQIQQQQQADLAEQQNKLDPVKAPTGVDLQPKFEMPENLLDASASCIELQALKVDGATLLDEWEVEVLEVPFIGKCINSELVSAVLASTTDFYIQRGFITTRAYLPNQNLRQGNLRIVIAEGKVEDVLVAGNEKGVNLAAAFPIDKQEPLHIRDLEQAVDQLNAVPGNDVAMEIVPGDTPDASDVVFTNHGDGNPTANITLNDGGSESTGKNSVAVALSAGDLLNMSDVWSLSGSESHGSSMGGSKSLSLSVNIPDGYNTYSVSGSDTQYDTTLVFPTTGTTMSSSGATQEYSLSADRLIFRDQGTKHSVGATLTNSATQSYIGGQLIGVNSRTTDALNFHGQSIIGFGDKMLIVSPAVEVGLSEVDNLPTGTNTPVENPQAEYVLYKVRMDWSQPLTLAGLPVQWKSAFNYQYSGDSLYGSQQISIGGQGSVRGFKGVSFAGDSGYFWQNSLVYNQDLAFGALSGAMQYTLGYDFGEVSTGINGDFVGAMQGMFLEASFKKDNWRLGVSWSNPLNTSGTLDKGESSILTTLSLDL